MRRERIHCSGFWRKCAAKGIWRRMIGLRWMWIRCRCCNAQRRIDALFNLQFLSGCTRSLAHRSDLFEHLLWADHLSLLNLVVSDLDLLAKIRSLPQLLLVPSLHGLASSLN